MAGFDLYDVTGGMTPAEIGGAVLYSGTSKARQFCGKVSYGQLTTITANPTGGTGAIAIAVEKPFSRVRIAVANVDSSSVTLGPFKASTMDRAPTDALDSGNNSGAYTDITFSGSSTVTIDAAPATDQPVVVWSDWIDLASIPRTDGGLFPVLTVRGYHPSGTITVTANSSAGWRTAFDGRFLWSTGSGTGDFVTSGIESYPSNGNNGQNLIYAVETFGDEKSFPVTVFGDSVLLGTNVDVNGQGFLYYGMSQASTNSRTLSFSNYAWPGRNTSNSLIRFSQIIKESQPSISVFFGYSTNDGSPTASLLSAAYDRVLQFVEECRKYNTVPVVVTPLLNTAWTTPQKELIKHYRHKIRALNGTVVVMDVASVLLTEDELGFIDGVLADTVHLNQNGTEIAAPVARDAFVAATFL